MTRSIRRFIAAILLSAMFISGQAQPLKKAMPTLPTGQAGGRQETRLFKILISGKQVTIKSSKNIQHVMLWTGSGHRVIEQREINADSYTFTIPINEKIFFLMVAFNKGKIYTDKIGLD